MRAALRVARLALTAAMLLAVLVVLAAWGMLRRSLPQVEGTVRLAGLHAEVTVERDAMGVPHIRAQSLDDLLVAQGYVVAQDRLWQMDLLRRAAAGELAEIFGEVALEHDIESRTLGFRQAAETALAAVPVNRRAMLEGYARGVNQYMEQNAGQLPPEFLALRYKPRPWEAKDTLLIAANLYKELTGFWPEQMLRHEVSQAVGPELANDLYAGTADSEWDRPLVGAAAHTGRSAGAGSGLNRKQPRAGARAIARDAAAIPVAAASPWAAGDAPLPSFESRTLTAGGSNNWVVDGRHTRSGRPLLENDTHLAFGTPAIWYLVHLTAPEWNVKGFTFPGGPLVVIGHNEHIAWGFTNNFADVADVYIETFNPQNPAEYRVNGEWRRAAVRHELIRIRGGTERGIDVAITRHGPVIRREGNTGYALRWTATEPGGLDSNYFLLGAAKNWDEFRTVLRETPGPAQNAVYADVDGHIGYFLSAQIPIRKQPAGSVPVPGDTDEYEWTGYIPREELPQVFDPPEGVIATANARVTGPGFPWRLTDNWMAPYRVARIYELLGQRKDLRPEDCITIATDIYSYPHVQLARELAKARTIAKPADPRTGLLLDAAAKWDGRATVDSAAMSFLDFTRRALLYNLLQPRLGSNVERYDWFRAQVFLEMVLRGRPARWLPRSFQSYDELLISSADLAVRRMGEAAGRREREEWEWGRFNLLRLFHPLGRDGMLRSVLSIGPLPVSGSFFSVKQIGRTFGPVMRFVADLSNFDGSLMNVSTGQSGHFLSENYRDQFSAWYEGRGIASVFSEGAEQPRVTHRLRLLPSTPH